MRPAGSPSKLPPLAGMLWLIVALGLNERILVYDGFFGPAYRIPNLVLQHSFQRNRKCHTEVDQQWRRISKANVAFAIAALTERTPEIYCKRRFLRRKLCQLDHGVFQMPIGHCREHLCRIPGASK
jgi:hypothetical protein